MVTSCRSFLETVVMRAITDALPGETLRLQGAAQTLAEEAVHALFAPDVRFAVQQHLNELVQFEGGSRANLPDDSGYDVDKSANGN